MSRKRRSKRKNRTKKTRISKRRVFIFIIGLILSLAIALFAVFKLVEVISPGVSTAKENIESMISVVFGDDEETNDESTSKQFDLQEEKQEKKHVVYIDAAGGGQNIGYKSKSGTLEKDINLQVSKLVSSKLSAQGDVSVVLSRTTDKMLSTSERVEDSNKQDADVLVSIKMTGHDDPSPEGAQAFYRVGPSDASDQLATLIQKSIVAYVDLKDRGVTPLTFDILKENDMPAVVLQCGFLSNPDEEKKLIDPKFQEELAEGIAQGILSFLDAQG